MSVKLRYAVLVCAISMWSFTANAAEGWRNTVTPYFLAVSIDGQASLFDRGHSVSVPFDEVLDQLDIGGMLRYRGENERWSVNGEVSYMKLSNAGDLALGPGGRLAAHVDAENEMLVVHTDLGWKFVSEGRGFAEVYLGVRYTDLTVKLRLDVAGEVGRRRLDSEEEFFDPVIGLRSDVPLAERWVLKLQLDAGGFGVGMDSTMVGFGALEYRHSDRLGVWFGYQGLGQNFKDAGAHEALAMDVTYHGPALGVALSW